MRVFERIGRMVRADAHGMMDELEERSLILKQHLREAELEVTHKRARIEALDEERRRIRNEGRGLEAQVASLDDDVELAMAGDDPALARFAVKRWLPKREALDLLFAEAARLQDERERLDQLLKEQETQLAALRPRVRAALARPGVEPLAFGGESEVTDEEIDLELLRRRCGDDEVPSVEEGVR